LKNKWKDKNSIDILGGCSTANENTEVEYRLKGVPFKYVFKGVGAYTRPLDFCSFNYFSIGTDVRI